MGINMIEAGENLLSTWNFGEVIPYQDFNKWAIAHGYYSFTEGECNYTPEKWDEILLWMRSKLRNKLNTTARKAKGYKESGNPFFHLWVHKRKYEYRLIDVNEMHLINETVPARRVFQTIHARQMWIEDTTRLVDLNQYSPGVQKVVSALDILTGDYISGTKAAALLCDSEANDIMAKA